MQREKSVKVKEVIESLCKLLCALGVDSVPGAETFRRAKFNLEDSTAELWRLLYSILSKAVQAECACRTEHDHSIETHVRSILWQCGYSARWLQGDGSQEKAVGSRDLLLTLGWLLSTGSLLETLLVETAQGLKTMLAIPEVPFTLPRSADSAVTVRKREEPELGTAEWERGLKLLRWHQGKLRFRWQSLLAAQEERAGLLHQILSTTDFSANSTADPQVTTTSARHSKELERLRAGTRLLERYLDWKRLEPIFWCWMESLIDAKLAEPSPSFQEDAIAVPPKSTPVKGDCCRGDEWRRAVDRLGEKLQTLQAGLRAARVELEGSASSWARFRDGGVLTSTEEIEIQERVGARLQNLTNSYDSTAMSRCYRLRLQEQRPPGPQRSTKPALCAGRHQGKVLASQMIRELQDKEALLLWELGHQQQVQREEILEQASRQDGVVLIPPLKR